MKHLFKSPYGIEAELPAKWSVCSECEGSGTELRGGLKGMAFTAQDLHEDPEFFEDYCNGAFDTKCSKCEGRTTVPIMNPSAMSFAEKRIAVRILQEQRYERQAKAERDYFRQRGIEY